MQWKRGKSFYQQNRTDLSAEVMQLTATTQAGFEEILADELRSFGARDVELGRRAVYFKGDLGFIYKVNFRSRFALRVLKPIKTFVAIDEQAYYARIKAFPWENYITNDKTLAIKCALNSRSEERV